MRDPFRNAEVSRCLPAHKRAGAPSEKPASVWGADAHRGAPWRLSTECANLTCGREIPLAALLRCVPALGVAMGTGRGCEEGAARGLGMFQEGRGLCSCRITAWQVGTAAMPVRSCRASSKPARLFARPGYLWFYGTVRAVPKAAAISTENGQLSLTSHTREEATQCSFNGTVISSCAETMQRLF